MADMTFESLPKLREVLKKGKADIRIRRSGVIQLQTFEIVRIDSPFGRYPVLHIDKIVDLPELLRLSQGIGIPVSDQKTSVFPKGKMAKDFAGL